MFSFMVYRKDIVESNLIQFFWWNIFFYSEILTQLVILNFNKNYRASSIFKGIWKYVFNNFSEAKSEKWHNNYLYM